ncbi:hypothetical protein TFLX_01839 [Thermoflexales bacterium]|nr:hypothetical protein TFLX_01839 [Thermoflexales bacterium]
MDPLSCQLMGQPRMAVEVHLDAKWAPGGHTEVAQAQLGIDEVEVVVQTLPRVRFEKGFRRGLVMPWFVTPAGFQRGEDMGQSRLAAAFLQNGFNAGLFAKVLLANVFNRQTLFFRNRVRIRAETLRQRLGKLSVIENANALRSQVLGHPLRIASGHQTPCENDTIITVQDTVQVFGVFLGQGRCRHAPPSILQDGGNYIESSIV